MERKKRSKGRGWESCFVKKIYGMFGVEMRAYGQKLVQFCKHTHTRVSYSSNSSIDYYIPVGVNLFSDGRTYYLIISLLQQKIILTFQNVCI